jgi:carboxymethylenebutenolidase
VASGPDRARELSSGVRANTEEAVRNMKAATAYLREQKVSKIASLGWCFGGQQSLNLSLSGEPLDATVIYYGNLVTEKDQLAAVQGPVLGIFGDQDTSVSVESARAFDAALDELGVENSIHIYPGVGHAFANPSGMNYAAEETKDAWAKTLTFLEENLK